MAAEPHTSSKPDFTNLTPDEADRYAAAFRPIWELPERESVRVPNTTMIGVAPPSNPPSAASNPASAASAAPNSKSEPRLAPKGTVILPAEAVAQARSEAMAKSDPPIAGDTPLYLKPSVPPPPARARAVSSDAFDAIPVKKSKTGLFVGIAVVAVLALVGVKVALGPSEPETQVPTAPTRAPAQEEIPPPSEVKGTKPAEPAKPSEPERPARTAEPEKPARAAEPDKPARAAEPDKTGADKPASREPEKPAAREPAARVESKPQPPPAPRSDVRTAPKPAPKPAAPPPAAAPAPKTAPKPAGGGIVRDNPF